MKSKFSLIAMAFAGSLATTTIHAQENPWYVGLSANFVDLGSIETLSTAQVANVTRRIGIDSDDETGFGLTVGRTVFTQGNGNNLSLELNYSNSDHDIEEVRFMNNVFLTSEGRAAGSTEIETILLRAKYQFDLGRFQPYVGLGIGESDLSVEALYGASIGSQLATVPPFANGSDSATALELRAGLEYQINDSFGVFVEYSSTDVDDVEFSRRGGGPGGLATTTQSGDFDFDSLNVGLNFRF
ncbi:MAG: outer membrane beta-barrel protein [Pseudomonadota bacterium]